MNELTIDGKNYISSKKAAEITGYAKDYVGQLCREGHVEARMVGRSWYVLESSIRAHRFGGDPHAEPVQETQSEIKAESTDTWEKPTYVADMAPSMPIPNVQRSPDHILPPVETVVSTAPEAISTAESLTDMQAAWKEWFAQKQDTLIESPEIIDAREEAHEHELEEEESTEQEEAHTVHLDEIEKNIQAFKDAHRDIEESHHAEIHAEQEVSAAPVSSPEEMVRIQPIEPVAHVYQPHYEEIEEESEPVIIHHAPAAAYADVEEREEDLPILSKKERRQAMRHSRKARKARATGGSASSAIVRAVLIVVILIVVLITAIGTGYAERFITSDSVFTPVIDILGGASTYSK